MAKHAQNLSQAGPKLRLAIVFWQLSKFGCEELGLQVPSAIRTGGSRSYTGMECRVQTLHAIFALLL